MQILEGEHDRLGPRPRQKPCGHRRELPPPQFFRREIRGALRGERNVDQRRDQGRIFARRRGQPAVGCSLGRRGAVRRAGPRQTAAAPIPRGDAAACSAKAARRAHLGPGVWCLAESRMKLLDRGATFRDRAPRRSGQTGPRRRGRGPSGEAASQCPPHARRRTLAPARRPFGRRRWRERLDKATGAGRRPSTRARPSPRRRRARPPGAARFP